MNNNNKLSKSNAEEDNERHMALMLENGDSTALVVQTPPGTPAAPYTMVPEAQLVKKGAYSEDMPVVMYDPNTHQVLKSDGLYEGDEILEDRDLNSAKSCYAYVMLIVGILIPVVSLMNVVMHATSKNARSRFYAKLSFCVLLGQILLFMSLFAAHSGTEHHHRKPDRYKQCIEFVKGSEEWKNCHNE